MAEELGYEDFTEILEMLGMLLEDDYYDDDVFTEGIIVSVPF